MKTFHWVIWVFLPCQTASWYFAMFRVLQKWFEPALWHSLFLSATTSQTKLRSSKGESWAPKAYHGLSELCFMGCFWKYQTGRILSISCLNRGSSLFPTSSLSQSSYWMSWPSSRTPLLCCWMGKFFRNLLLRISKSSGKERFIWLFKLPNNEDTKFADTWRSKGVLVTRNIWSRYWKRKNE